jgi:hypothetical protein
MNSYTLRRPATSWSNQNGSQDGVPVRVAATFRLRPCGSVADQGVPGWGFA